MGGELLLVRHPRKRSVCCSVLGDLKWRKTRIAFGTARRAGRAKGEVNDAGSSTQVRAFCRACFS